MRLYLYQHWTQASFLFFFVVVGFIQSIKDLAFLISKFLVAHPQPAHVDYIFPFVGTGLMMLAYRYGYEKRLDKMAKQAADKRLASFGELNR